MHYLSMLICILLPIPFRKTHLENCLKFFNATIQNQMGLLKDNFELASKEATRSGEDNVEEPSEHCGFKVRERG